MRSPFLFATSLVAAGFLAGCSTVADVPAQRVASATLLLSDGIPAGTAQVLANGDTLTLAVGVTGVTAGAHGIHLHAVGSCARPDFASAGGHLNPLGRQHGSLASNGQHAGDLPNIMVGSGRTGTLAVDLPGTRQQVVDWLFDADGTAIVLHAEPDDYRTDPSGNSGARIACGVLKPA
ncbi:superoxide dismutase family protein [Tsuneonella sp. HG249]